MTQEYECQGDDYEPEIKVMQNRIAQLEEELAAARSGTDLDDSDEHEDLDESSARIAELEEKLGRAADTIACAIYWSCFSEVEGPRKLLNEIHALLKKAGKDNE